jgi:hypothetical protein
VGRTGIAALKDSGLISYDQKNVAAFQTDGIGSLVNSYREAEGKARAAEDEARAAEGKAKLADSVFDKAKIEEIIKLKDKLIRNETLPFGGLRDLAYFAKANSQKFNKYLESFGGEEETSELNLKKAQNLHMLIMSSPARGLTAQMGANLTSYFMKEHRGERDSSKVGEGVDNETYAKWWSAQKKFK